MYGETNHHASTIGVNVKIKARFVKFDLAEIVLFFAKSNLTNQALILTFTPMVEAW